MHIPHDSGRRFRAKPATDSGRYRPPQLMSLLLPICANCKKIRDDKGYWNQIEAYIRDRSDAKFSHGICPDCAKKLYSDLKLKAE